MKMSEDFRPLEKKIGGIYGKLGGRILKAGTNLMPKFKVTKMKLKNRTRRATKKLRIK